MHQNKTYKSEEISYEMRDDHKTALRAYPHLHPYLYTQDCEIGKALLEIGGKS